MTPTTEAQAPVAEQDLEAIEIRRRRAEAEARRFVPFGTRVLILREEAKDATEGGVVLPDAVKEPPARGVVLRTGRDCKEAVEGELVLFQRHAGWAVEFSDDRFAIIDEADLYGSLGRVEQPLQP